MEHCASLGTRAIATKQLGSFPEAKEKDPKTQELTGSVKMKKRKRAEIALPDSPVLTADSLVAPKLHYRSPVHTADSPVAHENASALTGLSDPYHRTAR